MPQVTLMLCNRSYTFSVPAEEEERLRKAADLLNARARALNNREMTAERLVATAALQIAFDAISGTLEGIPDNPATLSKLSELQQKISVALNAAES